MDCKNARLLLTVAHPLSTELDVHDKAELASHLAGCADCGPWAENECRLDECLGKAVRAVPVPPGLVQRLQRRLDGQRDAWYRSWAVRTAGVAAALFLAFLLGWALWWNKKPTPDLVSLQHDSDSVLSSAAQVEQFFAHRKGVTMTAPPDFDYNNLCWQDTAGFQGKQVPCLLFVLPGNNQLAKAWVYVLSDRQFNLDEIRKQTSLPGSRNSIAVLSHPHDPNVLYVVVHTSGTRPEMFFPAAQRPRI